MKATTGAKSYLLCGMQIDLAATFSRAFWQDGMWSPATCRLGHEIMVDQREREKVRSTKRPRWLRKHQQACHTISGLCIRKSDARLRFHQNSFSTP